MGVSSRTCGRRSCRCEECVTTVNVVRNRNNEAAVLELEGVAMAGLVAILRQLGDLGDVAAEIFDDLQEQVMAASARGRRLAVRAKQLDADLLLILSSSSTSSSAAAAPIGTVGRLGCMSVAAAREETGMSMTTMASSRLVAHHVKRCRGPPRLSLLDRFDAAGEGACLKRYTDPSFFRTTHTHSAANNHSVTLEPTPKFHQSADDNSETPECQSAHTDCKCKTEADASQKPSPGFLSTMLLLRQLKHPQTAGSSTEPRDLCSESDIMEVDKANEKLQGASVQSPTTNYCSDAGSCELERTSSFEAWLSPDARFTQPPPDNDGTTCNIDGFVNHGAVTQEPPDAEITCNCNKDDEAASKRSRYKGGSVEMTASTVISSLPRKLFMNLKHQNDPLADCSRSHHAGSLPSRQGERGSIIGDCNPEAFPIETFLPILVRSDPASSIHNLLPQNEKYYFQQQQSTRLECTRGPSGNNVSADAETHHQQEAKDPSTTTQCSNSPSIPETCGDPICTPDSKNLLLPGSLHTKRSGVLPENSCSEDTRVDTPPLPPIPPIQWLSEKVYTGPRAASLKHRAALWKKSQKVDVDYADRTYVLHSVRTKQVAENTQARSQNSHDSQTTLVDTEETLLVFNENANANVSHTDEMKCSEEISTQQPFREDVMQASEGIIIKAGEFPEPAVLPDKTHSEINQQTQAQAQAYTWLQQEGRQQFGATEKLSEEHEAVSDSSSNVSVFFSAVQQLANMSPPSVPKLKYSPPDVGSHGRITLRNGPSLIHPSRNILDKDKPLKLKQISGASSPVTGSPTNSKMATILQRADGIRQAQVDTNDVEGEVSSSNSNE